MAVVIDLQGIIGFEIIPKTVSRQLVRAKDEDIIVRLSTLGGDVFDGADIVNLFMDHRRDNPDIQMDLEVKAIAGSSVICRVALISFLKLSCPELPCIQSA